jgi:methylmalonyl-CoA/ethylmalonyl-CoA epimerase
MSIALNQLGQISLTVDDVDAAESFYANALGLRKLFRFGDLLFFDCAGVRLLIEKSNAQPFVPASSVLYFRTPDIGVSMRELKARGVTFVDSPHLIAPMEDHDLWMVFFRDSAGNVLALMHEAPKGYQPAISASVQR